MPFDLTIKSIDDYSDRLLKFSSVSSTANNFRGSFESLPFGDDSDQLVLKLNHSNSKIANEYLNSLLNAFDQDGIKDRQLEYARTIEFVNQRSKLLEDELRVIEARKEDFKKSNKLSDIKVDADVNIEQQFSYNNELFNEESKLTLANYLLKSIETNEYDYLPINIGMEDFDINNIIIQYNQIVSDRNKYLSEAGPNNLFVKSLESQLESLILNIQNSINNYQKSTQLKIEILSNKEKEFENVYGSVPKNEKILRSIERELSVKKLFSYCYCKKERRPLLILLLLSLQSRLLTSIQILFRFLPTKTSHIYFHFFGFFFLFPLYILGLASTIKFTIRNN